ncbi:unnamed protein product, partial [Didymodactylos carnosus]
MEKIGFAEIEFIIKEFRSNTRTLIQQENLANELFLRVKQYLPQKWPGHENTSHWDLGVINEQIRFCKYEPGQHFSPHFDGVFKRDFMEQSQLTIMVYLNDEFDGGNTNFLDEKRKQADGTHVCLKALKPQTGMVLIFQHDMYHEGEK